MIRLACNGDAAARSATADALRAALYEHCRGLASRIDARTRDRPPDWPTEVPNHSSHGHHDLRLEYQAARTEPAECGHCGDKGGETEGADRCGYTVAVDERDADPIDAGAFRDRETQDGHAISSVRGSVQRVRVPRCCGKGAS
jgi:hypothetical protein